MSDSHQSLTILIVEDNPGDLFLLEELLKGTSLPIHRLIKVVSAADAIQVLEQEKIKIGRAHV